MLPVAAILLISLQLILTGCSGGGPPAVKPGTNAFYWQAANENFPKGDYLKTSDQLERVMRTDNEFKPKAQPWRLALLAGMMNGYRELANQYELGGRTNKANPGTFRKLASNYRGMASRSAMALADAYKDFSKDKPQGDVELVFPYPGRGTTGMPPSVLKIAAGNVPTDNDIATVEAAMLQRGVLRAVCDAVGAPGDAAKAQEMMKTTPVTVPRAKFEMGLARAFYDASEIFNPYKGSEPVRQRIMLETAAKALKNGPDAKDKDVVELSKKIDGDTKALEAMLKKMGR
ncbi:MAG: hypothetical protein J0L64_15055 [Acidobacteria bacterium]|nr:hypothetical protein [Acidobacteriota bacterium]